MKTGSNRKLYIGMGIGVTFAVIIESAIAWGFVGATASMGALGLIALTGSIIYVSLKILRRSYRRRMIKRMLSMSEHPELSGNSHPQPINAHNSPKSKLISEKDKRFIVEHIDEIMHDLSDRQSEKPGVVMEPITAEDKKTIMEHIDEILVLGSEYGGEQSSSV